LTLSAAATLVVMGGASASIWLMMRISLQQALDQTLHTEAQALASRLEEEDGRIEFEFEAAKAGQTARGRDSLVQVVTNDERLVFSSPELAGGRPLFRPGSQGARGEQVFWFRVHVPSLHDDLRVVALHAVAATANEGPPSGDGNALYAWVLVARSLQPLHDTLRRLAGVLSLTVAAASVAALLLSHFVARGGTAPIRALASDLSRVRAQRPELTIGFAAVPVELDPIVNTVEQLLERIRRELERQRQLTADVAHDLRTPLAGVRTLLDVCIQRPRQNQEYVATIQKAQAALRQLSELVDNVLTLARLDSEVDQPAWATVSVAEVVAGVIATLQPLATARGVTLRADCAGASTVRSDRNKLTKVLSNLLANAVEHSPASETVFVGVEAAADSLRITVEDRGPGIPPELRNRMFERFARGDTARAGDGHHGLGLPIARGLARLLGGDVQLDDSYTSGSRFVVVLPGAGTIA
jgi:signal transduction histidine kinase